MVKLPHKLVSALEAEVVVVVVVVELAFNHLGFLFYPLVVTIFPASGCLERT